MKKIDPKDEAFVVAARQALDAGIDDLDPKVAQRLQRARLQAVNGYRARKGWYAYFPYWLSPARVSIAAVGLLAVSLVTTAPHRAQTTVSPDDLDVITSQEQVEMIQDLDFYRWLAASGAAQKK